MHLFICVKEAHSMEGTEMNETGDRHWVGRMGWKECGDGSRVQRIGKGRDALLSGSVSRVLSFGIILMFYTLKTETNKQKTKNRGNLQWNTKKQMKLNAF